MPRHSRPAVPAWAAPCIASFRLALRADGKSPHTIYRYIDVAGWIAGWLTSEAPEVDDWADVTKEHLRLFFVHLQELGYSRKYVHNVGGSLQAYFKWLSAEEQLPNPFTVIKPPPAPPLGATPPPVLATEQLATLIKDAEKGRNFESRRDTAMLRLFGCTGGRLEELTELEADAIDLEAREVSVRGKGGKVRRLKFDAKCAVALDRYFRLRGKHRAVIEEQCKALWLPIRGTHRMTPSGIRQALQRRAKRLGIRLWPHLFRHTFAHNWLLNGGSEGDLLELTGWESTQMLKVYGRSARGVRARRNYDLVGVMGGV